MAREIIESVPKYKIVADWLHKRPAILISVWLGVALIIQMPLAARIIELSIVTAVGLFVQHVATQHIQVFTIYEDDQTEHR